MKKGLFVLVMLFLTLNSYGQVGMDVYKIGEQKYKKGDFIGAIKDYTIAIEMENPIYKVALRSYYYWRGMAKQKLEDHRGAIEDFTNAIVAVPEESDFIYSSRGGSKGKLKNYTGAIIDFSKAIEINPKEGLYYVGRGLARVMNDEKDQGCRDLSRAGELGNEMAYDLIRNWCN
jgi:tetratricopeptide (TPR) repeat protein